MSEKRFAEVTIDGIELEDDAEVKCKCTIIGGEAFWIGAIVTTDESADGDFNQQIFLVADKGFEFGIQVPALPKAKFDAVVAAIKAKVLARTHFVVTAVDDWRSINHKATIKNEKDWIKIGRPDGMTNETFVEGIEFRFISKGPA